MLERVVASKLKSSSYKRGRLFAPYKLTCRGNLVMLKIRGTKSGIDITFLQM